MLAELRYLLPGVGWTVGLFLSSALLATVVSLVAGVLSASPRVWLRWPVRGFIEIFRGTSALVQLFWVFFVLPMWNINLSAFFAATLVLGLNSGSYGAELVRGALRAVAHGQKEACRALGLKPWQTLLHVVLPQALFETLPPYGNLLVELLKNTALASMIGLLEITQRSNEWRNENSEAGPVLIAALLIYFLLALAVSRGVRGLENRLGAAMHLGEHR